MEKFVIAVYVDNQFGVLTRVTSMFTRRGFNIDSLTVGETETPAYSRITITMSGTGYARDQLINQLRKLFNVKRVDVLDPATSFERELMLLKVENNGVVYGKDGTMYQKFFTLQEAATSGLQIDANIDALSAFVARHPGLATVMIVPSADTILTDLLPAGAPFVEEEPWLEKISDALGRTPGSST